MHTFKIELGDIEDLDSLADRLFIDGLEDVIILRCNHKTYLELEAEDFDQAYNIVENLRYLNYDVEGLELCN